VTVSSSRIDFNKPIPSGSLIELIGKVSRVGNTSVDIEVTIYIEQMYSDHREEAIGVAFTLVAVDNSKKPVSVL